MMFFRGRLLFYIHVQYQANFDLDNTTFGVDPQYRLSDERHMTFYNQFKTSCQSAIHLRILSKSSHFKIVRN
jgi:stress response protein SCP2